MAVVRRHKRLLRLVLILILTLLLGYYMFVWVAGVPYPVRNPQTGEVREITVRVNPSVATRFIGELFPIFLRRILGLGAYLLFFMLLMVMQFVAMFWYMSRGRTYVIYPKEYDVTFADVRGQQAVVNATQEVLRLFQGFKRFREIGGYPPHGILFEGPPGTGKTLLSKAVAGEARVPFIYASGTSFANMFFGVGNLRIWSLFRKARRLSERYDGAVIFLDELDAVGGSRGAVQAADAPEHRPWFGPLRMVMPGGMGMGSMLVNELLVQMDGLVTPKGMFGRHLRRVLRLKRKIPQYNILIIGATNQVSTLDPALLRPGRFDRKIHVGLPDGEGRRDIIEYYLAKVHHAPIDVGKLAQATVGYSPARIKNVINEALIFALQNGREALNWDDLWQAKLTDEIGLKQPVKYSAWQKEKTAIHEAGHAVVSHALQRGEQQIQVITIQKREAALGLVHGMPIEEVFSRTKEQLLAQITVLLAGMAAEEIWFGTSTTGPSSDLEQATQIAAAMIGVYGMGKDLVSFGTLQPSYSGTVLHEMLRDPQVRREVNDVLQACKAEVTALLKDKALVVEGLRDALLEKEELIGDEITELMARLGEAVEPVGAAAASTYVPHSIVPGRPGYLGDRRQGALGDDRGPSGGGPVPSRALDPPDPSGPPALI